MSAATTDRSDTSASTSDDLSRTCRDVARRARDASRLLATASGSARDGWLRAAADRLIEQTDAILAANGQDLEAAPSFGLTDAAIDRLRLTPKRIADIADALRQIAAQDDPLGQVIEHRIRPNGLDVSKIRVPLGVVFFIYESRPNVTADAAGICVKSGNAVILRGGKEARHSSMAIVEAIRNELPRFGLPTDAVQIVETTDRAAVGEYLRLAEFIDVTIPRGGESLIRRVASEATMPVIKHFDGNCHVYVDAAADLTKATAIVVNAKCQRMGVCNAAESLLVHQDVAESFLPSAAAKLIAEGIELRGCERTRSLVPSATPATDDDYRAEFLGPILSVKIVASVGEAIDHINQYGSRHTDAIVTEILTTARTFTAGVDTAAVMINASTRFHDGGELGLGAEIGISTDKFHARGPCGTRELTTTKYVVIGDGHVRG